MGGCNLMKRFSVVLIFSLLPCISLFSQNRVSARVEVKNLAGGNVVTSEKSVYCSGNGRLIVCNQKPLDYIMLTGASGGTTYFFPGSNEYYTDASGMTSSKDELLSIFLLGRLDDLGVSFYGYALQSTERVEEGLVKRTYKGADPSLPPKVEIVYGKDYLPIYSATFSKEGKTLSKNYFSHYTLVGHMPFPARQTSITYTSSKDSTIVRTIYSNLSVDGTDPMFDFAVPSDAKQVDISAVKSALKK